MKFALWGIIGFVVVMWLLRTKKAVPQPDGNGRRHGAGTSGDDAEAMIRCTQCGMHIPESEAIIISRPDAVFCSEEHRIRHHRRAS
ncbi:MAG: hypothetical protein JWQ21_1719 [Herminiimonas sp.]|nr:hypothetical protein [Herminiimonas sp.]